MSKWSEELQEKAREEISIKEFIEEAHKELFLIEKMDGEVIFSSYETFKKGKYYFLGLNPGGAGFISIKDSLDKFLTQTTNDYFDASWNSRSYDYEKGMHPLQQRVQYLFETVLHYDFHNVFSTNLIFKTTKDSESLNYGLAGLCWKVHQMALNVVQPEIIITCGNGNGDSAFYFISDLYAEGKYEQFELTKIFSIKTSNLIINGRPTLLIGIPHLSRFEIRNNEAFSETMNKILEKHKG